MAGFAYITLNTVIMSVQLTNRITINPEICHGKPVIRGLGYPIEVMLELMASGMTTDELLCVSKNDIPLLKFVS